MIVSVVRHGGFAAIPALSARAEVDTASLPEDVARRVTDAVASARLDEAAESTRAGGDRRIFDVTLSDEAGTRTFRFTEPLPPDVRELVSLLLSLED